MSDTRLSPPCLADLANMPIGRATCRQAPRSRLDPWEFAYDDAARCWRVIYDDYNWPHGPRKPPTASRADWATVPAPDKDTWQRTDFDRPMVAPHKLGRPPYHWLTGRKRGIQIAFNTETRTWAPVRIDKASLERAKRQSLSSAENAALVQKTIAERIAKKHHQRQRQERLTRLKARLVPKLDGPRAVILAAVMIGIAFTGVGQVMLGLAGIAFWAWLAWALATGKRGEGGFSFIDTLVIYGMISLGLLPLVVIVLTVFAVRLLLGAGGP